MVSDRLIRMTIAPVALMTLLTSVVVMAIAASLESHWSSVGFPSNSYRDRERLLLVAGIWGIIVSAYSLVGALLKPGHKAFGIFYHLIAYSIAFILYLCGVASLTALTNSIDCGDVTWSRCNVVKGGLVSTGWIGTIFTFIMLVIATFYGIKARSGVGARNAALNEA
ncbi:hypothetical protein C6P46_004337 [Rhodotorula mucilaginosa]|uniref:MARVEL domain-containing protein n=1 Tax=Rhodotorula mucilaginosa TaxID=5537 RepID=A0A9P6W7D2_RHOMI|nr:hypothetical protein C6P46_004337 [Rhodotorula mucilaginosa]TKA55023.1 hypothetical protein B0A53_02497 [Rhodotorula sp. CCFEE 5036]